MDSRKGSWKLFPSAAREICQTDPSEGIHESVWRRAAKEDGPPLPHPYRDEEFLALLQAYKDRMERLSPYETSLLRDLQTVEAEKTLPRSHRVTTFCDRIVEWLGGS